MNLFCPCCANPLADIGDPESADAGHYLALGPAPLVGDETASNALSWDCLCRSCGFSFVIESDLRPSEGPLSRATRPEEAAADERRGGFSLGRAVAARTGL